MNNANIEPPIIVIFGITGDLSRRKLLPALYHMLRLGNLPPETKIIGTSRREIDKHDFMNTVELCVLEKDKVCDPEGLKKVEVALETLQLDPNEDKDYEKLKHLLHKFDQGSSKVRMFYMSVPSTAYGPIVSHLANNNLNTEKTRLLLEKPFGYDFDSASKLISLVNQSFKEDQIYRIDHYLAKETAQNLLAFRMHNPIFSALWSCEFIQSIHIRAFETIGIEGRDNFYEQTGAARDFIQSHLMQLLSITMMDMPKDMTSKSIHDAKQSFFNDLIEANPHHAIRGQYDSYKEEVSNPRSHVETYAKILLKSTSEKWRDTNIILETGKAMQEKSTDIVIEFKTEHERRRNSLTFQIQPNEGISLDLVVKEPGLENNMHHTSLDFRYDTTFKDYEYIDAYERVLMDAIIGDQSLFASDQEVLSTWKVLDPVIKNWQSHSDNLVIYTAGSKGINLI